MSRGIGDRGKRRYTRKPSRYCACWSCTEALTKRRILTERRLNREALALRQQGYRADT